MTTGMLRRRTAIWIACFAILLNALAPTVSAAIAAAFEHPRLWAEIQGRGGFAPLAHTGNGASHQVPDHHGSDHGPQGHSEAGNGHCPFCLVHAGSFGAVAPAPLFLPVQLPFDVALSCSLQTPPLAWRQTPAQARAPPRAP